MSEHGCARGRRFIGGGRSAALLTLALGVGCTAVAGLDKEYVAADEKTDGGSAGTLIAGSGGRSGSSGQGGSSAGAGAGNGGSPDGGGSSNGGSPPCDGDSCGPGLKCCTRPAGVDSGIDPNERRCVLPNPGFGCSLTSCDACPAPPLHATSICRGEDCVFECDPGYTQQADQCIPDGGSGGTGSGGSGGGPPVCQASQCPPCKDFVGPIPCCRRDQSCGCTWFPTYCW